LEDVELALGAKILPNQGCLPDGVGFASNAIDIQLGNRFSGFK